MLKKILKSLGLLKSKALRTDKPVGVITHYYGGIEVAIIKFSKPVSVGQKITIQGATTDFSQEIKSMQYDHKEIQSAKAGQEVGIKSKDKVREGDSVYFD
ncbi:MAG: translation elongation factor-like protein [Candidatus Pacebacteria bacterium]|nr:translation elongation factor-like protein [Candidatus Paceibacterota bacterium]